MYALHVAEVRRGINTKQGCLDWLIDEPPDEWLHHTIWIYRLDWARVDRLSRR